MEAGKLKKIGLVIWGITDIIYSVIRNSINPKNAEILLFIDSDIDRQGIFTYETCKFNVIAPEEYIYMGEERILVTALSAFQEIKRYLMKKGINENVIHPFITSQMEEYFLGDVRFLERCLWSDIYFQPNKVEKIVDDYISSYKQYITADIQSSDQAWYEKSTLIAHALGGYQSNEKELIYTNSIEAFNYAIDAGYCLLECDVLGKVNGEWVLGHDYYRYYDAKVYQYTILSLKEILSLISIHPNLTLIMDIKWDTYEEYYECIDAINSLVKELESNGNCLKKQIVIEVYDEPTIQYVYSKGYEMFFTEYRNPYKYCFMRTVNLCNRYRIAAVGMSQYGVERYKNFIQILVNKNLKIFVHSTDKKMDYCKYKEYGIQGIFTNFIREQDVESWRVQNKILEIY